MSISILNRGASSGLKPELTVTAPSGSTVDLLQNGIIVATYTLGASETEHTFVVKVGSYTVRGTLGTQTKSVDVVVDTAGQYTVTIEYCLYLYNKGDECKDVTGGWIAHSFDGGDWAYGFRTANDLTAIASSYTKCHIVFSVTTYVGGGYFELGLGGTTMYKVYTNDPVYLPVPTVGVEHEVSEVYEITEQPVVGSIYACNNLYGTLGKVREKRDDCLYVYRSQLSG